MDAGFDQTQSHWDSNLFLGILNISIFLYFVTKDPNFFGWVDASIGVICQTCANIALVSVGKGI